MALIEGVDHGRRVRDEKGMSQRMTETVNGQKHGYLATGSGSQRYSVATEGIA